MPPPEQPAYTDHHTLEPHTDPSAEADGHTNSSSGTGSSTTVGVKQRGRRRTSAVWESFDEEISVVDGVQRVVARCKRCKKEYTGEAKGGTGHLKRHVESHAKVDGKSASGSAAVQTQLSFNPDGGGELAKYLNSDKVMYDLDSEEDFNLLQWWQEHKLTFPVLSILARDVLSVPVSTVSSESAFSLAGRIIEERRTSLAPDMVRTLMSVKDGELSRRRAQHTTENIELLAMFEEMNFEEDPED
ncbi:hypothetical protein VPH35_005770 [Triticum aestivum]